MKVDHRFIACAAALSLMACGDGSTELTATLSGAAEPKEFTARLSGGAERPNPVATTASGDVKVLRAGRTLMVTGSFYELTSNATAAHIHGPADENSTGPVLCSLQVHADTIGLIWEGSGAGSCGEASLTDADVANLDSGKTYVNIHDTINPNGELRGQLRLRAPSAATGTATVTVEDKKLKVSGSFAGLEGDAESAEIHGPGDEDSISFTFCLLQVPFARSGTIEAGAGTDSCGGMELSDTDVANFENGRMYINFHTKSRWFGGEIRGQLGVKK
jgi:hypothetical protein